MSHIKKRTNLLVLLSSCLLSVCKYICCYFLLFCSNRCIAIYAFSFQPKCQR